MKRLQVIIPTLVLGIIISFIPMLLTGNPLAAAQFSLAFTALFILPVAPWVALLNRSPLEQLALSLMLGLAGIPIVFFVIGVLHGPLTTLVLVGVPLIIFFAGAWKLTHRKP